MKRNATILTCALIAAALIAFGVNQLQGQSRSEPIVLAQDAGGRGAGGRGGAGMGGRGGFGGAGMAGGGMMGGGMMAGRMAVVAGAEDASVLGQTVQLLADLNLQPDFNLNIEQKQKIKAIREEANATMTKWRTEKQPELQKLRTEMQDLRGGGDVDRDKMRALAQKQQELMQTVPDMQAYADQIKAVLTEDQAKALDAKVKERQNQTQELRRQFQRGGDAAPGAAGGRGGAGGAPGGRGGAGGAAGGGRGARGGAGGGR